MFKAIRDSAWVFGRRVGTGWHQLHQRELVRLFLFEFIVVLLGVLTAQALSNWSGNRQIAGRSEEALAKYRRDLADGRETALFWIGAMPCLQQRVSTIMVRAGDGSDISADLARRPGLWSLIVEPLDVDTKLYARRIYGPDWLQKAGDAAKQVNRIDATLQSLAGRWMQFTRLDPANGKIREGDVLAARDAAAAIQADLRTIAISAYLTNVGLGEIGIESSHTVEDGTRRRPARNCGEIARAGQIAVPVGTLD